MTSVNESTHAPRPSHHRASSSHARGGQRGSGSGKTKPPRLIPSLTDANAETIKKKAAQFQWDFDFANPLPSLPAMPKRLHVPLMVERLTRCTGGTLVHSIKHTMLVDRFLSLPLDLIDTSVYTRPENVAKGEVDDRDKPLLFSSTLDSAYSSTNIVTKQQPTRAQLFKQGYSNWARKPEYTANANFFDKNNKQTGLADVRRQQQEEIARRKEAQAQVNNREVQIAKILATFNDSRLTPVHRTKKGVHAVNVRPVLPLFDSENEKNDSNVTGHGSQAWLEFDDNLQVAATRTSSDTGTALAADTTAVNPLSMLLQQSGGVVNGRPVKIQSLYKQFSDALAAASTDGETKAGDEPDLSFAFQRDYVLLPTPPVDFHNNYYFILTNTNIYYSRYTHRQKLGKRMRKARHEEQELMEKRPARMEIQLVDQLGAAGEGEDDDDVAEPSKSKRRRVHDEDDEGEGDEGEGDEGEGDDDEAMDDD